MHGIFFGRRYSWWRGSTVCGLVGLLLELNLLLKYIKGLSGTLSAAPWVVSRGPGHIVLSEGTFMQIVPSTYGFFITVGCCRQRSLAQWVVSRPLPGTACYASLSVGPLSRGAQAPCQYGIMPGAGSTPCQAPLDVLKGLSRTWECQGAAAVLSTMVCV